MTWRTCGGAMLLLALGAMAFMLPYFVNNLHQYGVMVPIQESIANHKAHHTWRNFLPYYDPEFWMTLLRVWFVDGGLWRGGWSFTPPSEWFVNAYELLIVSCVSGLLAAAVFKPSRISASPVSDSRILPVSAAAVLGIVLGMIYHALESLAASNSVGTMAWYAAVAIPWLMLILARGALAYRLSRLGHALALAGPALFILTEIHSVMFRSVRVYADTPISRLAISRLASLQISSLGSRTLIGSAALLLVMLLVAIIPIWQAVRRTDRRRLSGNIPHNIDAIPTASSLMGQG